MTVTLTSAECEAVYSLIDGLSGGNPENVFSPEKNDDPKNPTVSACVKIFIAAEAYVPTHLVDTTRTPKKEQ